MRTHDSVDGNIKCSCLKCVTKFFDDAVKELQAENAGLKQQIKILDSLISATSEENTALKEKLGFAKATLYLLLNDIPKEGETNIIGRYKQVCVEALEKLKEKE